MRKCKLEHRRTRASSPPGDEAVGRSAWKRGLKPLFKISRVDGSVTLCTFTRDLGSCVLVCISCLSTFVFRGWKLGGVWRSAAQTHVAACLVCVCCRISNASSYLFFSGCVVVFVFRFVRFFSSDTVNANQLEAIIRRVYALPLLPFISMRCPRQVNALNGIESNAGVAPRLYACSWPHFLLYLVYSASCFPALETAAIVTPHDT